MTEYQQLLQAIEQYYGSGSDQWAEIAKYGIASDQAEQILKQVPGVNIVKNANGSIRSYNLNASENIVSNAEQAVNSNVPAVIKSFEVPANTGVETITSGTGEAVKQMTFKSGLSKAGNFVFGEVAPRVAAVATGITLGKTIDKLLYNVNPDFWDEHGMETLNPDTWGNIIGTNSVGARVLNTVLGTTPNGKTQAYIDEQALAYMTWYLQNQGVFNTGGFTPAPAQTTGNVQINTLQNPDTIMNYSMSNWVSSQNVISKVNELTNFDNKLFAFTDLRKYPTGGGRIGYVSKNPININSSYNVDDRIECYDIDGSISNDNKEQKVLIEDKITRYSISEFIGINPYNNYIGNINGSVESAIDGVGTQEGAKTPDLSGVNSVDGALNKLKDQYPDLWNNAVNHDVVQPDGSTKTYTYVPVAMPELDKDGNPVSSTSNQATPQVNPATATESLLKTITDILKTVPPINPPDTGDGDTPVAPPVTGSASSLYAIYNPTLAEINSFGAWLWSDNFIDQIKKLFSDPMQAIIGLHKIYAQPITGGAQNIKVGYLDSGVSAATVANQYTTIDCGTVRLSEQFHNVFDYAPFTEVNLYLPFIGIVRLDVSDVMRASIHIVYHVDVLSGACLADVKIVRDSSGGTLYQYAGNASVTLPISSGSYMGIVASVAGIAGGIAGTIASGGSALPLIATSASSIFNAHTRVEHSGGFSGNAGAMGGKIPYLIISRPQTAMAKEFNKYIGYPSNFTTTLGSCSGFVKVLECHLENINATKSELEEIDTILKEGVII